MPFSLQPPVRRLTHSGKDISTLDTQRDIAMEIIQEVVEAIVFASLAISMGANTPVGEASSTALLTGMVLMASCADRLAVVCDLIIRLNETEPDEQ
jgi:hypothetical protein